MAKKRIEEDLELEDEILDEEFEEEIDDIEDFDEVEEDDELEEDVKPSKKASKKSKKSSKKKLSKGKKAAIAISVIAGVALIAVLAVFVIMPLLSPSQTGEVKDAIDFSLELANYTAAPSSAVTSSVTYDVASILNDSSKSNAYKAAAAVLFTTGNEIFVNQYAFFRYQVGTTNLGSNYGTMIYERIRRETTDVKYDTTLKMPINHNFNALAVNFVQSANIRYAHYNVYHRMDSALSDMKYNEETGLIEIAKWKKQSSSNWNKQNSGTNNTLSEYEDMQKIALNVGSLGDTVALSTVKDDLINASTVTIEHLDGYYKIYFEVDIEKANADSETTSKLDNDNGGSGIKYEYCKVTIEIWDCGLTKSYVIDEKWGGKIQMFEGSADSVSNIKYSYTDKDCTDFSYPDSLIEQINNG